MDAADSVMFLSSTIIISAINVAVCFVMVLLVPKRRSAREKNSYFGSPLRRLNTIKHNGVMALNYSGII